jgi:hypothetical protein
MHGVPPQPTPTLGRPRTLNEDYRNSREILDGDSDVTLRDYKELAFA